MSQTEKNTEDPPSGNDPQSDAHGSAATPLRRALHALRVTFRIAARVARIAGPLISLAHLATNLLAG